MKVKGPLPSVIAHGFTAEPHLPEGAEFPYRTINKSLMPRKAIPIRSSVCNEFPRAKNTSLHVGRGNPSMPVYYVYGSTPFRADFQSDSGKDTIYGDDTENWIYGGFDVDRIFGYDGDDYLDGGTHGDTIDGGTGNDTITGG